MRTFKLTVAYEGTHYCGWQVQPQQHTIQSELQKALETLVGQPIDVVGSGRTDSGVHALGQVVSCSLPWKSTSTSLGLALNTKLPSDITVIEAVEAVSGFHAIRDASRKCYRYQLQVGGASSPFERRYRWRLKRQLDLDRMQAAAKLLIGDHDFAAFQAAGSDRKSTCRTVYSCSVYRQSVQDCVNADKLAIEVEANGFLYNMVRNIVGSLVEVGSGKEEVDWISAILRSKDRSIAGPTAPPHGLFLLSVGYPESIYLQSD